MSSKEDVIQKFAQRKVNSRSKTVSWSAGNVYCEGDVIYSYGAHFPMAKYLGDNLFIKNGDKYSSSTSSHQSSVDAGCPGPTVSRHGLQTIGINFIDITKDSVICIRPSFRKWTYKDTKTDKYYEEAHTRRSSGWGDAVVDSTASFFVGALEDQLVEKEWIPPEDGEFVPCYKRGGDSKDRIRSGSWQTIGAVVLKHKRHHYLCSYTPKGIFFAHKMPSTIKTMKEAFVHKGSV